MKTNFFLLFILFICSCCNQSKSFEHPYSFYYWKTTLSLSDVEKKALNESTGSQLYVRLFDVDKQSGTFVPIGVAKQQESFITDKEIVPVIFIRNRTFHLIQQDELHHLAVRTNEMINMKMQELNKEYNEIQIDCDWTEGTKDDFFEFLKLLKQASEKEISSTLRLHQVKDKEKSGIPPVNKVYLMCYSTSSPFDNSTRNSILDVSLLKNYLHDIKHYPIKDITVALPIYSWAIVENHMGKHKLINGLTTNDLQHKNFKYLNENKVIIMEDGFYFGFYLNKGFTIKIEEIEQSKLKEVVTYLETKIGSYPIVYYHLDEAFINKRTLNL